MTTPSEHRRAPDRREFLTLGIGVFVAASVPLAARRRPQLVRRTLPLMGTIGELVVVHRDPRYAERALDAAFTELARVEARMTRFAATSDVGRANAQAAREGVAVSPETARVIAHALSWAEASDGAFDPALGRVSELWDVSHRTSPPPPESLVRLAGRRLYQGVDVATHTPAVRLARDVQLDLGGIAKGYGIDRAVGVLREWGITSALVNVGGDLYALGRRADGEPWRVGIQSPLYPGELAGYLDVADEAVATSGDYERFFRYRGVRYHHLMDPATAAPRVTDAHSVTVRAPLCIDADAGATAVYGADVAEATRRLDARRSGARLVRML